MTTVDPHVICKVRRLIEVKVLTAGTSFMLDPERGSDISVTIGNEKSASIPEGTPLLILASDHRRRRRCLN